MQDIEFTIQEGKLWMLQTRNGKRTGAAMVRIAMEMLKQGMIDERTALQRVSPDRLNELLHPIFDPKALLCSDGHWHAVCQRHQALRLVKSSSLQTRPSPGPSRAKP
jgi:phosphoenolpyruvate synthase/pyruvate phosphate dikinase